MACHDENVPLDLLIELTIHLDNLLQKQPNLWSMRFLTEPVFHTQPM